MGLLLKKRYGSYGLTGIAKLAAISLLSYFGIALIDSMWAVYLESLIGNIAYVSFLSAFFTAFSFASYFFLIPIIERSKKSNLYAYSLLFMSIGYALMYFNRNFYVFVVLSCLLMIAISLKISAFGIIVRDKSNPRQLSRNEGIIWSFFNFSWVVGPLLAGLIAAKYGIPIIFLLGSIFLFITFLVFKISGIKDNNVKKKIDKGVLKNFFGYFKSKGRRDAYIIGGGVNFWYVLIFLYAPIMIIKAGFGAQWVGYFLFAAAIPTILAEFKMSQLAGKIGFKKIFKIAFFSLSLIALICFFVSSIYIIMGLLVLASFALSMIEPTTEAYFFDITKSKAEQVRYYGPYNTTIDASYFVGKIIAGLLLLIIPIRGLFLFFSFFMFLYFLYCFRIREIRESRKKK